MYNFVETTQTRVKEVHMENFCRGMGWGVALGVCIGGIIVAKNRRLANKIKEGLSDMEDKIEEAKDNIAEKLQETDCNCLFDDGKQKSKNNCSK